MSILPPDTLGIMGGGQLGRMFVMAARSMGYEVIVLDPDEQSPAGSLATEHLKASYTDRDALDYLAGHCSVITTEFENIPVESLQYLERSITVSPSADALSVVQNRIKEKSFIQSQGLATAKFICIHTEKDLGQLEAVGFPAILKTARLGYDGKGQVVCESPAEVSQAYTSMGTDCVLEQKIELQKEVSVILSRNHQGEVFFFPVAENVHVNGILDTTSVPADIPDSLSKEALIAAAKLADALDYCGVLAVEFFISTKGELLVNEIAPRPHNSGHFTLNACYSSQFEQQLRMICDLPSGNCNLHTPVVMLNILGDVWPETGQPDWQTVLQTANTSLHLYGKKQPRTGRKMGHINFLSTEQGEAYSNLQVVKAMLNAGIDQSSS